MTEDELFDLLTDLESTVALEDKPARFEAAAAALAVGEYGRASLLVAAGEHWQMRKEYDEARRCFAEALADAGETAADPLANVVSLALDEGDEAAVTLYLGELRDLAQKDGLPVTACLHVGESLEGHGRLREAHRWFTMPLTWSEDEDDVDYYCLVARLRVREALGLPQDRFDLVADEERAARRRERSLTDSP